MAFESGGGQKFPYTYDQVFTGLLHVLPRNGFTIKQQDKSLGRVMVSSGMSLLSWGENIDISVEDVDGFSTRVEIHSGLKVQGTRQAIVTGEHRNAKNVNAIIFALNEYLKTQPKPQRPTITPVPPPLPSTPPPQRPQKKCPYCAEMINQEAIKCRYCGSDLVRPTSLPQPAANKPETQSKDIQFNCNDCGQHLVVDRSGAGLEVPCPECGVKLTVPS